ncbi:MAG: glycosyltransferase [Pseudomonadota bacterium]|nr:glycosyltransferase [Pseudomonadota bacterium]
MLFIYRVLPIGGIETFFVRMAKERHKNNLNTTLLLLSKPNESNQELLKEMQKYSMVLFYYDIVYDIPILSKYFPLITPIKKEKIINLFKKVDQIHAFVGMHALLGQKLSLVAKKTVPITIGFYHYITYTWGDGNVAYHEKLNRQFVFDYLPKECLLFWSEGNKEYHATHKGMDFSKSKTFRLGVVDKKNIQISGRVHSILKIVAVGRLVEFKTYNLYMLDIVRRLLDQGIPIQFDIYGDGPLHAQMQKKIEELNLHKNVFLKGSLDYSLFDETIAQYDLFIGSGTAIIQAASLGVPSIVGVENMLNPKTYGYFSNVHQYEYNLKNLDLKLFNVEEIILDYFRFTDNQRLKLKNEHLNCTEMFTNQSCQDSMDKLKNINMPSDSFKVNYWLYEISRAFDQVLRVLNKNHPYNLRFKKLQKTDG